MKSHKLSRKRVDGVDVGSIRLCSGFLSVYPKSVDLTSKQAKAKQAKAELKVERYVFK